MSFIELLLIALGLSMDAFAVAICRGLSMKTLDLKRGCLIALFFGGFQALMPLIGWFLGAQFEKYINEFDHWIAFALLLFIGGKLALESFKKDGENHKEKAFSIGELTLEAIATSIDALAVGITFAFLRVNIAASVSLIGITTFILSFAGVLIGYKSGASFKRRAELIGGIILILIGVKILLEHLGVISIL